MGFLQTSNAGPSEVTWPEDGPEDGLVWAELTWVPEADGSLVQTVSHGFVVTREQLEQVGEGPPKRIALDQPGAEVPRKVGDVIEEHVQLVNPKDRHFVAVLVPLAAGMEPMNPNLATAPAEARPSGSLTRAPDYAAYLDDHVAFFYETLPKGTYDFYFRTRAAFEGSFVQPPARAEMMYDGAVYGHSSGARVAVERGE